MVGVLASASLAGVHVRHGRPGRLRRRRRPAAAAAAASSGNDAKYERIWDDFRSKDKKWARRTSECEAGGDRNIHGGGGSYHGAFQFMKSTWKSSPKSVGSDPHNYSWKTQAVVAVLLKKRDGAGHWPVCG